MPLYDFQCDSCDKVQEHFAKMDETTRECICGGLMQRKISTNYFVHGEVDFVTDHITGDPVRITSRKQMDRLCKEHGVTPKFGKGWV